MAYYYGTYGHISNIFLGNVKKVVELACACAITVCLSVCVQQILLFPYGCHL